MGIAVEFNPELCLRTYEDFKNGKREEAECIPENIEVDKTYEFLKEGQRNYWIEGELPLIETRGWPDCSRPLASVEITEVTHFMKNSKTHTRGKYKILEVFDANDPTVHFEGIKKVT